MSLVVPEHLEQQIILATGIVGLRFDSHDALAVLGRLCGIADARELDTLGEMLLTADHTLVGSIMAATHPAGYLRGAVERKLARDDRQKPQAHMVPSEVARNSMPAAALTSIGVNIPQHADQLRRTDRVLGDAFDEEQNSCPGKLRLLVVDLIGQTEWSGLPTDLKGDAYEGLLEKNARDTKSGAGQYFTPRPLIEAIVECVAPQLGETICDPACGTTGFLLSAHQWVTAPPHIMSRAHAQ
jgi:hypothetical protein